MSGSLESLPRSSVEDYYYESTQYLKIKIWGKCVGQTDYKNEILNIFFELSLFYSVHQNPDADSGQFLCLVCGKMLALWKSMRVHIIEKHKEVGIESEHNFVFVLNTYWNPVFICKDLKGTQLGLLTFIENFVKLYKHYISSCFYISYHFFSQAFYRDIKICVTIKASFDFGRK